MKDVAKFCRNYPLTSFIIAVDLLIFGLNWLWLEVPLVVMPGEFSLASLLGNFSHTSFFHIAFNMVIFSRFAPLLEKKLSATEFMFVFLGIVMFLVAGEMKFLTSPVIGFSGVGLGTLAFAGLLFRQNTVFAKSLFTLVIVNVLFGFMPGISFVGHALGAAAGIIVFALFFLLKKQHII